MGRAKRSGRRKSREELSKGRVPQLGYYYIMTDTDQTEKNYLEGLRDAIPDELKRKIVIKVAKARTRDLVKKCKEEVSLYRQYSEPWIVFDRDQVKNFNEMIKEAEQNGIHAAWSNPCFEIWMYAYFGRMPEAADSIACCKQFAIEYEKRTGQKYDKAEKDLYRKLCRFGDEKQAIVLAEQKRIQCRKKGNSVPTEMVPCTTMDLLVKEIANKTKRTD